MTLSATLIATPNYDRGHPVYLSSLQGPWLNAIDAGGLDNSADLTLGTAFNPTTQITDSSRRIISIPCEGGTNIIVGAFYDAAATTPTGGTYVVFGRYSGNGTTGPWVTLRNKSGSASRTPNYDVNYDASNGSVKRTSPTTDDMFDALGCNEILIGTLSAHTVGSGSAALAGLTVKVI